MGEKNGMVDAGHRIKRPTKELPSPRELAILPGTGVNLAYE